MNHEHRNPNRLHTSMYLEDYLVLKKNDVIGDRKMKKTWYCMKCKKDYPIWVKCPICNYPKADFTFLDDIAKQFCKICPSCDRKVPTHDFFTKKGCRWCDVTFNEKRNVVN